VHKHASIGSHDHSQGGFLEQGESVDHVEREKHTQLDSDVTDVAKFAPVT
jgi:hypothetical protein